MLVFLAIPRKLAESVESHPIELGGIGPVLGVLVDRVSADSCGVALRDDMSSGCAETFGIGDDSWDIDFSNSQHCVHQ